MEKFLLCAIIFASLFLAYVHADVSAPKYQKIGCYKDDWSRAIPTLEGQDPILDGDYWTRKDAIDKCYQAAKKKGFQVFAVQNGGQCFSSASAFKTYYKYGKSSDCKSDGEGGPWANQVYHITGPTTGPTKGPTGCGMVGKFASRLPGKWPWHVRLHLEGDKTRHFCSGTLISSQWVITTAYCLVDKDIAAISLTLGELYQNDNSGHEQTYGISMVIIHPKFVFASNPPRYDFALIGLTRPAIINEHVQPACLPESTEKLPVGVALWETGWERFSQLPEFLTELEVFILDPRFSQEEVDSSMFITGFTTVGYGDTCRDDLGGPVGREENGRWILEGVHSWGRSMCGTKGQYDGQADVRAVLPWIKEIIENN